jgi:hypothetical protein
MNVISRLKELCGFEYTNKMQKMFTDITLSGELNHDFKAFSKSANSSDFNVLVLTLGSWPLPMDNYTNYRLPREIEQGIMEFNSFYLNKLARVGRKLTWNHNFSRGTIGLIQVKSKPTILIKSTKYPFHCAN